MSETPGGVASVESADPTPRSDPSSHGRGPGGASSVESADPTPRSDPSSHGRGPGEGSSVEPADPTPATDEGPHLAAVDAAVGAALDRGELLGAVVLAGQGDRLVHRGAYGRRVPGPEEAPLRVDDLFDLGDLTKPLATALAVMVLVDDGRLSPSDLAVRHLPELPSGDHRKITLEHLLLHTSGLPAGLGPAHDARPPFFEIVKTPLLSRPGERFLFSDLGYLWLQEIVERVAERPLPNVAGRVWLPLGLRALSFAPRPTDPSRCVQAPPRRAERSPCEAQDPAVAAGGGVAGHAGLFSTADDVATLARMLLRRGALGVRVLGTETVKELTKPRRAGPRAQRAYGWDVDSGASTHRGDRYERGGIGHASVTGAAVWIDSATESYVVLLPSLPPGGTGRDAQRAFREVATAVADAVSRPRATLGVEVLLRERRPLVEGRRVGLVTHRAAVDASGATTMARFAKDDGIRLTRVFSVDPPPGEAGAVVPDTIDPATGKRVVWLHGKKPAPTRKDLEGLDVLVVDLQAVGARSFPHEATLAHVLHACEAVRLPVVVLDRPSPAGPGLEGPPIDDPAPTGLPAMPLRHGMTLGELASMVRAERFPTLELAVVPMKDWRHDDGFVGSTRRWVAPSPSLLTALGAKLYPGLALLEATPVSIGRGTDEPFTVVGAPSFDAGALKAALDALALPGLGVERAVFTPKAGPFAGQACGGVRLSVLDERALRPVRVGLALLRVLAASYLKTWSAAGAAPMLGGAARLSEVLSAASLEELESRWQTELDVFAARRASYALYP